MLEDFVVWLGPELDPARCRANRWEDGRIIEIRPGEPARRAVGQRAGEIRRLMP